MQNQKNFAEKKDGILIKTSLVDYPGEVCTAFFFRGCNLVCPYCYNTGLVGKATAQDENNFVSIEDLFSHLEKRKNVISALVISGGEPLLQPSLCKIISKAKKLGYKIKLDTNGTLPDKLETLFSNKETTPDYIAMDIKTSPEKYYLFEKSCGDKPDEPTKDFKQKLEHSIKIISTLGENSYEFRTVLVPPLLKKDDIQKIAEIIPKNAQWFFSQFQNNNCLNPKYNEIPPYNEKEAQELVELAKEIVQKAVLR